MKRLEEIAKTFETSRPIFRLTLERSDSTITANVSHPVHRYRPEPKTDDVLEALVCEHFSEHFDISRGEFTIDSYKIANNAMEEIRNSMSKFLEKNLEMKNPRQSKIYKWFYRGLPNTNDFNDSLCSMYKYMRSFSDEDMRASSTEHINNAIAVMEAIMEKSNNEK